MTEQAASGGATPELSASAAAAAAEHADPAAPAEPGLRAWLLLVVLSGVFAIPASLAAALFIALVRVLTTAAWDTLPATVEIPEPALLLGIPIALSLVVGLVIRYAPGHGGPDPSTEHGLGGGHQGTLRELPGTVAAAAVSLASGASLGPEAPLVGILGTLGNATANALKLPPQAGMALGFGGLAAVLGGIFGNPLAVGILVLEVSPGVGRALYLRVMPGLVAATVGVALFDIVLGGPFLEFHFPAYPGLEWWHLGAAVLVGIGGAFVGIGYIRLVALIRGALRPLDTRVVARALVGGVAVGVIALVFGELTLFSGEHEISEVIERGEEMGLAALLLLAVGKVLAGAVSLSTGFRGGRIFPALFIGGTLGMAVHVAFPAWPAAAAVATGMAGMGAATFRLPLFLVTLLVLFTSPDVIPLMLLAAIGSWVVAEGTPEL